MGILQKRKAHIIKKEEEKLAQDGQTVTFSLKGEKSPCSNPACSWDETYQCSTNPTCPQCKGKFWIYEMIPYTRKAFVHWVTGLERKDLSVGGLKVGDCVLTFSYKDEDLLNKLMLEKGKIKIQGKEVVINSITPQDFGTMLTLSCSRVE